MLRRSWFFSVKNTHLQTDITYSTQSSQQKACHASTFLVFSVKNTHLQTDITYSTQSSQQKACHASTFLVFSVKNTHSQTDITSKSSKNLPFFDVTGFLSKKHSFAN